VKNTPDAEYNLAVDVPAAQKLFASGVTLFVMPLDSTQIKLEELRRSQVFATGTSLTSALAVLTQQWSGDTIRTPTLFDCDGSGLCPESAAVPGYTHETPDR
jgi:inosine-uridine nucleoside N-ribohydrolase